MNKNYIIEELSKNNVHELFYFLQNNIKDINIFHPHPISTEYLENKVLSNTKDKYIMLYMDGIVVGYGLLRGWDEGYQIPSLGIQIDRDYRRQGIGKLLMDILHNIAKYEGAKKVRLTVMKDNKIARKMYEDMGYKFRPYKDDRDEGILEL